MSERRRFIDVDGYSWQVYEIARADAAPLKDEWGRALCAGSLYFFSRDATRVLSPYPADWVVASWRELDAMCRSAITPRSVRPPERRAVERPRSSLRA